MLAFGTDGEVAGMDLVLLEDDKGLWPPYHVAPSVRNETLTANPGIADALNLVAPLLTDQVMSALNWQVAGPDKKEPADVARAFLEDQKLLGGLYSVSRSREEDEQTAEYGDVCTCVARLLTILTSRLLDSSTSRLLASR